MQTNPTGNFDNGRSMLAQVRRTMRGTKRCKRCGTLNGQRAKVCGNESCELRRQTLESMRPFDPVQLVVLPAGRSGTSMFSLRSKLNNVQPRNFVQITEVTLSVETHSSIVSRNAICYVDSCKYDAAEATEITCKHIKACTVDPTKPNATLPQAEVYMVSREVLWNLNIDDEQKQRLWTMYKEDEQHTPAVQRLNSSTFAVKCKQSKVFQAGRLHVTVISNAAASKKGTHACCCKKLKIIVEPDNSVVMEEDICDHLLLVLAAILSKQNGKNAYGNFTNALKSFWMPISLETPLVDNSHDDTFFGMNINIGGNFVETASKTSADDIFIFGDEFLTDNNMSDFFNLTPNDTTTRDYSTVNNPFNTTVELMHAGDPNLVSSCNITEEDSDMRFREISTIHTHPAPIPFTLPTNGTSQHLELSDCNIELMDQFQLTDQIDLCSNDIALTAETAQLYDGNGISIVSPSLSLEHAQPVTIKTIESSPRPITVASAAADAASPSKTTPSKYLPPTSVSQNSSVSLLKSNQLMDQADVTSSLPLIEMPTIAVVKKYPVKASEIVRAVNTRKFPYIPAKRTLIVNTPQKQAHTSANHAKVNDWEAKEPNKDEGKLAKVQEPSLAYSAWLEYVIETINESIEIADTNEITHTFHVHEEMFSHLSKSFSTGIKRRMPNNITLIKNGKHKGLMKYIWHFTTASTVRRIFSTKNITIELERAYTRSGEDQFTPYVQGADAVGDNTVKHRRIYPKLELYFAHIWFECSNNMHKTGLKVEWLPNAFPKSHFGILAIEFSLGVREPQNL